MSYENYRVILRLHLNGGGRLRKINEIKLDEKQAALKMLRNIMESRIDEGKEPILTFIDL